MTKQPGDGWADYLKQQQEETAKAVTLLFTWLFTPNPRWHKAAAADLKVSKDRITQEAVGHGGSRYQGPGGYSIPLVWLSKRMPVQFNRLQTLLRLSPWKGTQDAE
jgi:hypothetical protein